MGDNIAERKIRVFAFVPKNYVLYYEPLFWGKGKVLKEGFHVTLLGFTRAINMEDSLINFPEQKINAEGNVDIILNTEITYRVNGGSRPNDADAIEYLSLNLKEIQKQKIDEINKKIEKLEKQIKKLDKSVINSESKEKRRAFWENRIDYYQDEIDKINSENTISKREWKYNHPVEKYLKVRNNIVKEQDHLLDSEGIIEGIIKNVILSHLGDAPLDIFKNLSNPTGIEQYCKENNIDNEKIEYFKSLNEKIIEEISNNLAEFGLKLTKFVIMDANYTKDVNEEINKQKQATIKLGTAKIEAETKKVEAEGKAAAYKIEKDAETDIYKDRMQVFDGKNYKDVMAFTSPENMPRVTEKNVNLNGFGSPTIDDLTKSVVSAIASKMAQNNNSTTNANSQVNQNEEMFTDGPTVNEEQAQNDNSTSEYEDANPNKDIFTDGQTVNEEQTQNDNSTTNVTEGQTQNDEQEIESVPFTWEGTSTIEEVDDEEKNNDDDDQPKVKKI